MSLGIKEAINLYYYRFLRKKEDQFHSSEIINDIEFYTSNDCGNSHDFDLNGPVNYKVISGQDVQLLFGMESLPDAIKVLKCFNCYNRVLARFKLELISERPGFCIHLDEQVNKSVGSKYIMSDYNGEKILIPSGAVQVLSLTGWVAKTEAAEVLDDISNLEKAVYEGIISNAS